MSWLDLLGEIEDLEDAEFDESGYQKILNEAIDDQDELPVLQHALMRTWENWQSGGDCDCPIDFAHYDAIGGIYAAILGHRHPAVIDLFRFLVAGDRYYKILFDLHALPCCGTE